MTSTHALRIMPGKNALIPLAICFAYTGAGLLAQIEFPAWGNSEFSPLEMALWLAIFAGVMGTVVKLSASDPGGSRRRYWTLATVAIAAISILESADWFADSQHIWHLAGYETLSNFLKATLAIIIAAALLWSMKLPREYIWGVRFLQATVVFQFLSILFETTQSGRIFGYSYPVPQFSFSTEFAELLCVELYIVSVALADSSKRPLLTAKKLQDIAASGLFVGANARQVYRDRNLYRFPKYPPLAIAFYPVVREGFMFLVMFWLVATAGRVVRRVEGKPILVQIREMTWLWFSQLIDPPSYYAQALFKTSNRKAAPHYLTPYETKNGLFAVLNGRMPNPLPGHEMSNKQLFSDCCKNFGIPHPGTLLTVGPDDVTWHCSQIEIGRDLFCKPQFGMGAVGTLAFRYRSPGLYTDRAGQALNLEAVLQVIKGKTTAHVTLVQPWLRNHPGIADLAHESLITFRVVTCKNETDQPEVTHAMLRLLAKLEPGWQGVPDEEYAAPIDLGSGVLGLLVGDSMKTSHLRYEDHILTGGKIEGRKIPDWPLIYDLALKAHRAFPHRMVVGWDIALTFDGPVLLEGNTNMDVMFLQRVHNAPIGQSRLGVLINFHLKSLFGREMTVWHSQLELES